MNYRSLEIAVSDSSALIITETYLHLDTPDTSVQDAGRTLVCRDRTQDPG